MFADAADPLDAYANWRNRQTIITNYALTDRDTVAYLGALYRATRDVFNPAHFAGERAYRVATGKEAFTGEHTGRLQPALELVTAWALAKLTSFVVGRALQPEPFGTQSRMPAAKPANAPAPSGEVTTVVSPTGLKGHASKWRTRRLGMERWRQGPARHGLQER